MTINPTIPNPIAFLNKAQAIKLHAYRSHQRWSPATDFAINSVLDAYGRGLDRNALLAVITWHQQEEGGDDAQNEFVNRMLAELRQALYTAEEVAQLDVMAAEMAAMLEGEQPSDPQATHWAAFDALLASGDPS